MAQRIGVLVFGFVFGLTLSRSGASDYNYIHRMFTGEDLHLAYLMATAIVVGGIGMWLIRRSGSRTLGGVPIKVKAVPLDRNTVIGGAIFGLGWGLSGACPGTVLPQLGEGKLLGAFTVTGLLAGTYVFALLDERRQAAKHAAAAAGRR